MRNLRVVTAALVAVLAYIIMVAPTASSRLPANPQHIVPQNGVTLESGPFLFEVSQ